MTAADIKPYVHIRLSGRRRFLSGSVAGLSGLALAACSGSSTNKNATRAAGTSSSTAAALAPTRLATPAAQQPKPGGILRTRRIGQETHIDPIHTPYVDFHSYLFETMYDWLWTAIAAQKVRYVLADTVEQPDATTVVVKIHKSKFHDKPPVNGRDVTTEDLRITEDYYWSSEISRGAVNQQFVHDSVKYEPLDPLTIKFTLARPYAGFFTDAGPSKPPFPKELLDKIATADPIGSGPFQFKSRTPASEIELERFPDYWDAPRPYLAGSRSTVIIDDATAEASFLSNNIDRFDPPNLQTADRLGKQLGSKITVDQYDSNDGFALGINMHRPPFDDVRNRQALYHAVNRDALINTIAFGKGSITGPVAAGLAEAIPLSVVQPYVKYDPATAKQLLQQSGFPLDRTYELAYTAGDTNAAIAQLVAEDFKAVGIKATPALIQASELESRIHKFGGNWDFAMSTIQSTSLVRVFRLQHTVTNVVVNSFNLADPQVDKQIEQAEMEMDSAKRIALWQDLQKLFLDRYIPLMPLYTGKVWSARFSYVKDLDTSPAGGWHVSEKAWLDK